MRESRVRTQLPCLSVKTAAFRRGPSGPRVSQIEVAARATTSLGRLARVLRLSPTVSKRSVGLDLVEAGVVGFELVADPFDRGTHIGSVTVRAASSQKAHVMHAIVNTPVGDEGPHVGRQQLHDLELSNGQADVDIVPIGSAHPGAECQPTAVKVVL